MKRLNLSVLAPKATPSTLLDILGARVSWAKIYKQKTALGRFWLGLGLGLGTSAVPYNIQLALTLAVLWGSCDYFSPIFKIMLHVWETKESRPLSSWHIGSLQTLQAHHCSEQATQPPPPGDPGSSGLPICSTTGEARQTSESWAFPGPAAVVMVTGRHGQGRRCFGRNTCVSPALVLVTGTALAGVLGLIRLPRLALILVFFLPRKGGNV